MKTLMAISKAVLVAFLMLCLSIFMVGCNGGKDEVVWVKFVSSSLSIVVGNEMDLQVVITPENAKDKSCVYSTSNAEIVSVDQNGHIVALALGTARISVVSKQGAKQSNCVVTVIAEPMQLETPQNVHFDGDKVVWDIVAGRMSYDVELNGEKLSQSYAGEFFRDFEIGVQNIVRVRAVGDGVSTFTSEWSNEYTFTRLKSPTLSVSNGILTFTSNNSIENAKYDVYCDNELVAQGIYVEYVIGDLDVGMHHYTAVQKGDGDKIFDSPLSQSYSIQKLSAPSNIIVASKQLSFDEVIGVLGYNVMIRARGTGELVTVQKTLTNTMTLPDTYEAGNYDILVQSIGNASTTLTSEYSAKIATYKLSAPINLSIKDGVITWDSVDMPRNGYIVNVYSGSQSLEPIQAMIINENFFDFGESEDFASAGTYEIKIIATGDSSTSAEIRYINSNESQGLEIVRLQTPQSSRIVDNELTWNSVYGALNYKVLYDSAYEYLTASKTSFQFLDTATNIFQPGKHHVQLRAVGNGAEIVDSVYTDYEDRVEFTKLNCLTKSDFYIEESSLNFKQVDNAISYQIYIQSNGDEGVHTKELLLNGCNLDMTNYEDVEYVVQVRALATSSNFVMGEKSQEFSFSKIAKPIDLRIVNGQLEWTAPSNGIVSSYRIKIDSQIYNTNSKATRNDLQDYMYGGDNKDISVQAICDTTSNEFMWGVFSDTINVNKLSSNYNLSIVDSNLTWNQIPYAKNYMLFIEKIDDVKSESIVEISNNRVSYNLNELAFMQVDGNYELRLQAMADENGSFVNANISTIFAVERLPSLKILSVMQGVLIWDVVAHVDHYEVYIDGEYSRNVGVYNRFTFDNILAGSYVVDVKACGNGTTTLDSISKLEPIQVVKIDNNFSLSIDKDKIKWSPVDNASAYAYELRDENNKLVSSMSSTKNLSATFLSLKGGCSYVFRLKAIGDDKRYITSEWAGNSYSSFYTVKVLGTPSNLYVQNGIFHWSYVDNAQHYQLTINSQSFLIDATEAGNEGMFELSEYISLNDIYGSVQINMISVGGVGVDAYLSSAQSSNVSVYKFYTPTLYNNSGMLSWDSVKNNSSYLLTIDDGNDVTKLTFENNVTQADLPSQYNDGNYAITLQVVGDNVDYLTSEASQVFNAIKLKTPDDIHVENGKLVWTPVEGQVNYYEIATYKLLDDGQKILHSTEYVIQKDTLSYLFKGERGQYALDIIAYGQSNTQYLNSNKLTYAGTLKKLSSPSDLHVENGQFAWSWIENNGFSLYLNDNQYIIPKDGFSFALGEGFGAIEYLACMVAEGNSSDTLSSDKSTTVKALKMRQQTLTISNGEINWSTNEQADYCEMTISYDDGKVGTFTEQFECNVSSFNMKNYASGYYVVKTRLYGATYSPEVVGLLTSDVSEDFYIYKLATPNNFKLISDLDEESELNPEKIGSLVWDGDEMVKTYDITAVDTVGSIMKIRDLEDTSYVFADDALYVGKYSISLKAKNDGKIKNDSKEYSFVLSDESTISAYKLGGVSSLYVENGMTYWIAPEIDDETIEMRYILYVKYADFYTSLSDVEYKPILVGKGTEIDDGISEILHCNSLAIDSKTGCQPMGKYQIKIRTVGTNCLKSVDVACEEYYNYGGVSTDVDGNPLPYYTFDLFSSGDGTVENPYIIKKFVKDNVTRTAYEQFGYLNYMFDKNYRLQEYLILEKDFRPVGTKDSVSLNFAGSLSGLNAYNQPYTIDFSNVVLGGSGSVGLFSKIEYGGVVSDLKISSMVVSGTYSVVGLLVAENSGTVSNITVVDDGSKVTTKSTYNDPMVIGGIVGQNNADGVVKNCSSAVVVSAMSYMSFTYVGGIVGYNYGVVKQCVAEKVYIAGQEILQQLQGTVVGGIVGSNEGDYAEITECVNRANVYALSSGGSGGASSGYAGGIAGKSRYVSATGTNPSSAPIIQDCYNEGSVKSFDGSKLGNSKSGGIVASIEGGRIVNCYNSAFVCVIDTDGGVERTNYAGEVIGWNGNQNTLVLNTYYLKQSYSQNYAPDGSTALHTDSQIPTAKEQSWFETVGNEISDKFVVVEGKLQKLKWEVA